MSVDITRAPYRQSGNVVRDITAQGGDGKNQLSQGLTKCQRGPNLLTTHNLC